MPNLEKLNEWAKNIRTLILEVLAVSVALGFVFTVIVLAIQEASTERIVVEAFNVPKEFTDRGLGGEALAQEVVSELARIARDAHTYLQSPSIGVGSREKADDISVSVAGSTLSTRTIAELFRKIPCDFLRAPCRRSWHVSANVSSQGERTTITVLHQGGAAIGTLEASGRTQQELRGLTQSVAAAIMWDISPYILAADMAREKKGEAEALLHRMRDRFLPGPGIWAWATNLIGSMREADEENDEASEFPASIAHYRRASEAAPDWAAPRANLGRVLRVLAERLEARSPNERARPLELLDEAARELRAAVSLQPTYATAYLNLGRAREAKAKLLTSHRNAVIDLEERSERGTNLRKAAEAYLRAIDLAPYDSRAFNRLGDLYLRAGRHEAAYQHLRHAVELCPLSERYRRSFDEAARKAQRQTAPPWSRLVENVPSFVSAPNAGMGRDRNCR